ncbi:hypothetical protein [Streptomyces zaomyceticus]|uniref:hypothetical protein n=1 Tax=Streptomyces zaomyceticus TaxID=68286 RepID=UPI002E2412C6
MHENEWAGLSANLKIQGGFAEWYVEGLVRLAGSQKAGARIIESIEQKLAQNNIGHLPSKLPTDSTRLVLLYTKDQPGLSFIVRLVHDLATQDPDSGSNVEVRGLHSLLATMVKVEQARETKNHR